jgi:regulator of protease activity HflC (stomatin/prohibitin superfamily)
MFGFSGISVVIFGVIFLLFISLKVLKEYERGVIFRLGRLIAVKGPGIIVVIPGIDTFERVDLRTITMDVPPQDVITKDNVTIKVNAVVYLRVMSPDKAITNVQHYEYATSQLAQTTLRSVLGEAELDELLSNRENINTKLQDILDKDTDPWGVKVSKVEVKHIDLPKDMQRAMAKQAEAERERRAKVIAAEGELQASEKLSEAARKLAENPASIQLRFLQTLAEVATENNSTTIFPVPIDLFSALMEKGKKS